MSSRSNGVMKEEFSWWKIAWVRVVARVLRGPHPLGDLGSRLTAVAEQFHQELGAGDDVVRGCGEHVVEARLPGGQTKAHVLLLKCGNSPQRMLRLTSRKANLRPQVTGCAPSR